MLVRFKEVAAYMPVVECVCEFFFGKASRFLPESIVTLFDWDSTGREVPPRILHKSERKTCVVEILHFMAED